MKNYKELAVKYLKINKRRSTLTIIGAALSVMVIFLVLNLAWSYVLNERKTIREENDYEIIVMTETEEEIEQILSDENIESASVGSYYDENYSELTESGEEKIVGKTYKNAVYINTVNPYKMWDFYEYFGETYGIDCVINYDLWEYYFDSDGSIILVLALLLLLITFIFATFGVGIVRNAIQLSTLEQIRDYGNLRCIGASKAELKTFIYIESMLLESIGIFAGIIVGTVVSVIIGNINDFSAGFHFIALIPILICFYGDLYFAMQENAKLVTKITPIEAIRGEYKIQADKVKVRRESIFGKMFGVEADYAYKNVMRSPGRFGKTVFTITLGVAAAVAAISVALSLNAYKNIVKERYRYYQVYAYSDDYMWYTADDVQSLFPKEALEKLSKKEWVTEAKKMYRSNVMVTDYNEIYEHLTDEYVSEISAGADKKASWVDILNADEEEERMNHSYWYASNSCLTCYGYDEKDYARLDEALIEGTTDLSENGILIVNSVLARSVENYYEGAGTEYIQREITTYEVGDTIDIVNMQRLRELVKEKTEEENTDEWDAVYDCWQELIAEGDYETYTIEGILEYDANHYNDDSFMTIILPLERYYEFTGTDENIIYGMQYHINDFSIEILSEWYDIETDIYDYWTEIFIGMMHGETSNYISSITMQSDSDYILLGAFLIAIFIFIMNILNIFNTTAGNLHLRRREFAQLRVIGVSKKKLMKMVLLEGGFAWFFADILGIAIGLGIGYFISYYFYMLMGVTFSVMWLPIIIVSIASLLLILSASYFPMKRLQPQLAEDLTASGE